MIRLLIELTSARALYSIDPTRVASFPAPVQGGQLAARASRPGEAPAPGGGPPTAAEMVAHIAVNEDKFTLDEKNTHLSAEFATFHAAMEMAAANAQFLPTASDMAAIEKLFSALNLKMEPRLSNSVSGGGAYGGPPQAMAAAAVDGGRPAQEVLASYTQLKREGGMKLSSSRTKSRKCLCKSRQR